MKSTKECNPHYINKLIDKYGMRKLVDKILAEKGFDYDNETKEGGAILPENTTDKQASYYVKFLKAMDVDTQRYYHKFHVKLQNKI